jgi:hypothetical protein
MSSAAIVEFRTLRESCAKLLTAYQSTFTNSDAFALPEAVA